MRAVDRDAPEASVLAEAAEVIGRGGVVAFATETVYGLGADATSEDAVRSIFEAKGRPSDNPLIVHVASVEMARRYASRWPETAERLAAKVWPGPVTLVVPKNEIIASVVTGGLDTVGLRVPATAVARGLIEAAGVPLAAPSANRSEHVSPTTAAHVQADLDGHIEMVLDSGACEVGIESTVLDLCGPTPRVLRPGPLGADELATLLEQDVVEGASDGPARSPGQRAKHYAPEATALRVETLEDLVALQPGPADAVLWVGRSEAQEPAGQAVEAGTTLVLPDVETAARRLYAALRGFDDAGVQRIVVVMPPPSPPWRAVRDRLVRATIEG